LGGQIGYNIQVRQFVYGAEADLSSAWLDGSTACPGAGLNCGHSFNWMASVRGRAGITVNGNSTLLYGTAGVAWADVDYATKDTATGATFGTGFSNTHVGWVAGAGVEHMLTPNLSARVEYLYYGFDTVTAPAGALGGGPASLDLNTQTVRFGLNFKF
jgi:outer membrane immunogenic protein